jgi:hypothetical protein
MRHEAIHGRKTGVRRAVRPWIVFYFRPCDRAGCPRFRVDAPGMLTFPLEAFSPFELPPDDCNRICRIDARLCRVPDPQLAEWLIRRGRRSGRN